MQASSLTVHSKPYSEPTTWAAATFPAYAYDHLINFLGYPEVRKGHSMQGQT